MSKIHNNFDSIYVYGKGELPQAAKETFQVNSIQPKLLRDDSENLIKKIAKSNLPSLIFCHGGDGTLNRLIHWIHSNDLQRHSKIGLIPNGTGNDFARANGLLDLPVSDIIQLSLNNTFIDVSVATMQDNHFINVATCGDFAKVTTEVDQNLKSSLGPMSYLLQALAQLTRVQPFQAEVIADGERHFFPHLMGAFVANSNFCGGGARVATKTTARRPDLELVLIPQMPLTDFFESAFGSQFDFVRDVFQSKDFIRITGTRFQLSFDRQIQINLDGEPYEVKQTEFYTLPHPVAIALPPSRDRARASIKNHTSSAIA